MNRIKTPENLYEYIDLMRLRIGMYLGKESISALEHHVSGYQAACGIKGIAEQLSPPFEDFHDFVAREYDLAYSTRGWCEMILRKCKRNEQRAFQEFLRLFDLFRGMNHDKR